jgi:hypothetical protein
MTSPKGRFIYARYKTMERLNDRLDDMIAEGEMTASEAMVETIRDHRGRVECYAITIE